MMGMIKLISVVSLWLFYSLLKKSLELMLLRGVMSDRRLTLRALLKKSLGLMLLREVMSDRHPTLRALLKKSLGRMLL